MSRKFLEILLKPFGGRQEREGQREEEELEAIAAKEEKVFRYETLVAATKGFSSNNKLGEGGFGPVYKGRLKDGREVAVKRLGRGSRQGAREFTNEAMLLSKVQHKNVVNLYGYCAHADEKLLVYEYVANESLDKLLFPGSGGSSSSLQELKTISVAMIFLGREQSAIWLKEWAATAESILKRRMELDWRQRYGVIVGVARGLLYLHEDAHTPIIHRDIKASNILLDERWTPKIADFGMARLFPEDLTHVNTRVAGTNGYMAPEYVMHGSLSTKADVFSFGVLTLELVSGLKNSTFAPLPDAQSLLEWAWRLHKKRQTLEMVDPALRSSAIPEQVAMCIHIGLLCVQSDPKLRPHMRRVVLMLSKKPNTLEEPTRPGIPGSRYRRSLVTQGSSYSSCESSGTTSGKSASTSSATNTTTTSSATTTSRTRAPVSDQQSRSSQTKQH